MDNLDKELHRMSKIEPSKGFIEASKNRLMQKIEQDKQETWIRQLLKRLDTVSISDSFVAQARVRLMTRISTLPQAVRLRGWALFLDWTKKAVASTLVMLIAVTTTLFFVEGNTVVEASDNSYLEILSGTASIKHADLIVWENINSHIEVRAGDVIKVGKGSEVVVRFFDDTELRLGENSLFLISQLAVSPTFDRQAIIEVSLNEGTAWVQTLNVEDGYAGFTLSTRDAVLKTLNGTFNVSTKLNSPTSVDVFSNKVMLTTLIPETRETVETIKLSADQKADIHTAKAKPLVVTNPLSKQDLANSWVQMNQSSDRDHLTELREKGIDRLAQMAGTLPGQMLYPIKQIKERLELALNGSSDVNLQIEIANRRLNEALVLFEAGKNDMGREALKAYQEMAHQIIGSKAATQTLHSTSLLAYKLITPHQKTFTAELPNDAATGLVKDVLHETAESLASDPTTLEEVRLANSVERLQDIQGLLKDGQFAAATQRLADHALVDSGLQTDKNEAPSVSDLVPVVPAQDEAVVEDPSKKADFQKILDLRQEELALLTSLSETLKPQMSSGQQDTGSLQELTAMVESATKVAQENVKEMLPAGDICTDATCRVATTLPVPSTVSDIRLAELITKITLYHSWSGQQNQIERLLKNDLKNPSSIDYLMKVRDHLQGQAHDYLSVRILQLQNKSDEIRHKAVERKIERAMRLRQEGE